MNEPVIFTVTDLNSCIKSMFEHAPYLNNICVVGEISNFTNHYKTGHLYFTLKDENSLVKAVMFRTYASGLNFIPQNNMKVLVEGDVDTQNGSTYLGNLEQGDSMSYEAYFSPINVGPNTVKITIIGEEPSGELLVYENEYTIECAEPIPMDDMMMEELPPEKDNSVIAAAVVLALMVLGTIAFVLINKAKRKKEEAIIEDIDDDDEE